MGFRTVLRPAPPPLPRLYDSADDLRFDEDEGETFGGEPFADTVRNEDLGSRLRSFFAEVTSELEDEDEDEVTRPFLRTA